MSIGLGFDFWSRSVIGAGQHSGRTPLELTPSSQWNGTAGSGFGGSNPAAPSDPPRTLAKSALRLITPPNQWFTDTLDVGVIAAAARQTGTTASDIVGLA